MKEIFNTIKAFNEGMGVENAIQTFIPNLYSYVKTKSNGEKRYLYSGAKDDEPNAFVTPDNKFLTMHISDSIGHGLPMTSFDIVKRYICNGDVKQTYKYLVNQGYIKNSTSHTHDSLRGDICVGDTWRVRKLSSIDTDTIKPVEWLIDGIIPKGMVTLLYGSGASSKTTICNAMAVHLVEHKTFCERATHLPEGATLILYQSSNEDSGEIVAQRFKKMGLNEEAKENIIIIEPDSAPDIKLFAENISKHIKENNTQLLIIDSALALMDGRDDNQSGVVNTILQSLSGIAKKYDCAIILLHHTRKKNKDGNLTNSVDDLLGSQRWSTGVRYVLKASLNKALRETKLSVIKENILGLCPETDREQWDGELIMVADENLNFTFKSFNPKTSPSTPSKYEQTYNDIVNYISTTSLEDIKIDYAESNEKGKWSYLCKKVNGEYTEYFSTAAKRWFETNKPEILGTIDQI